MAAHFCIFLDSGSVSTRTKLNFLCLPPKRFNSEVKRRSLHLRLLRKPSSLIPYSSLHLVSTHEQSDGSVLFRFGDPRKVIKNAEMEDSDPAKEHTTTEDKDGHGEEKVIMDGDHVAEREMTSSSLTEVVHRNNLTVVTNKSSTVLAGDNDLNDNFPEGSNDHDLPTISNGELKATSADDRRNKGDVENGAGGLVEKETSDVNTLVSLIPDAAVSIPDNDVVPECLETIALVDERADSEHQNMESVKQTEIVDNDRESVRSNLVPSNHPSSEFATSSKPVECQNLQSRMQNLMIEGGSESKMNGLTALDLPDIVADPGRGISNSDAEANGAEAMSVANSIAAEGQASAAGIEMAEIVEDISESEMNVLTSLDMQNIITDSGHGINNNDAESESVGNSIAAEGQASAAGIELAQEIVEDISECEMNDLLALDMQNVIAGADHGINNNDAEAQSVKNSIAAEGQASAVGIELAHEIVEDISESEMNGLTDLDMQTIIVGTGCGINNNDAEANGAKVKSVPNSLDAEGQASATGIELASKIIEDKTKSEMNDHTDLDVQNILDGTGCGFNNNDAKSVANSIAAEDQASAAGIELGHEVIEDIGESDMSLISNLPPQREVKAMLDEKASNGTMESYEAENLTLNVDLVEASYEVTVMKSTESASKSKDISMADFGLVTGAALLPHPSKVLTGGEDAYFVAGQTWATWLGVADGVGEWLLEGTNPGVFAKDLIRTCERMVSNSNGDPVNNLSKLLNISVAKTHSPGYSTLLIAHFDGQALHVANIGDSGFIVLRHGAVYKRSSPMAHAFHFPLVLGRGDNPSQLAEFYRVDLEEGDVIIIATDGLLDNLYDQEISLIVTKLLAADRELQEIAELLATKAQEIGRSAHARSPFADNAEAAGYPRWTGGKLDDVTVILSVVRNQSSLQPLQ